MKSERGYILVAGLALTLLAVMALFALRAARLARETAAQVVRAHEREADLILLLSALQEVETGARGFVVTGEPTFLEPVSTARAAVRTELANICAPAPDPLGELTRCRMLEQLIAGRLSAAESLVDLREHAGFEAARQEVARGSGRALMDQIRAVVLQMDGEQRELLRRRTAAALAGERVAGGLQVGGASLSVLLLIGAVAFLLREGRLRGRAEDELRRTNSSLEARVRERTQQLARAAEASREVETRFRMMVDGVSDHAIYMLDPGGRVASWNQGAERLTGYQADDILGQHFSRFYPDEDVANGKPAWELEVAAATGRFEDEGWRVRKDGSRFWTNVVISPLRDEACQMRGFVKVVRDITERKEAEAERERSRAVLENLFQSLPGAFLVLTPGLRVVGASDAFLKATMTSRDGLLGCDLFDAFPDNPDDPAASGAANLRASLARVRQTAASDTMAIQRYDVRRPDGVFEERYWSAINAPVFGAGRELEYIVHQVEDVTEFVRQKARHADAAPDLLNRLQRMEAEVFQAAERVQETNRQLEAANRELETFSYSVSHDLRAPLRHVQGYVSMLERATAGQLSEKAERYLKTITSASAEMGQLIDDLLAFSRMSRSEMRQGEVDLNTLVRETIREMAPTIEGRSIVWQVEALPAVRGDQVLLRQVFANLIGNAVKYSGRRDPARIEIGASGDEDGRVALFVRDNGAGFDMQYAHKLFGVFQRLHGADEFEGTGIGLATVKRIVVRHGGRVWADGALDHGATFYFTLSRAVPA